MTIDQLTDMAYEVVSELEPARSIDVFDVSESHIIFQDDRGLVRISLSGIGSMASVKVYLKGQLHIKGLTP